MLVQNVKNKLIRMKLDTCDISRLLIESLKRKS